MRIGGTALVLSALGLLAAGCGSGSANPSTAPTTETGFAAYTACLAKNGVTLPSNSAGPGGAGRASGRPSGRPSGGPSGSPRAGGFGGGGFGGGGLSTQAPAGVDAATWAKAQEACASVRPTGGANGGGGANNSALAAYRNCLSEHGVTTGTANLNTADPKIAAAVTACAALRPNPTPTPTPAT
jgi:hypothetical protein